MDNDVENLISFVAEDHVYHKRSNDYYWTVGLIAIVVAVLSFIFHNALFGILVLIGAFMYGYVSVKKPKDILVEINTKNIIIGEDFYDIEKIEAFNILEIGEETDLVLQIKRAYQPMVSVCLPTGIANELKPKILSILKEDKKLIPHIGRRFVAKYKL